ncbi:hypothetical protein SK128_005656 [Halocaridina rubra]|uniref:Uncharacterized protein n=1 Tax=Halocaridina rubra TaxID=373956 RepID=A0AAN8ZTV9_HALRR
MYLPPLRGRTLSSLLLICMLSLANGRAPIDAYDASSIEEASAEYKQASDELKSKLSSYSETCATKGRAAQRQPCLDDKLKQEMDKIVEEGDEVVALTGEAVTQLQSVDNAHLQKRQISTILCNLLVRAIERLQQQIEDLRDRLENTNFPWWLRWLKRLLIRLLEYAIRLLQRLIDYVEANCPGWFGGGHKRSNMIEDNFVGKDKLMIGGENRPLID